MNSNYYNERLTIYSIYDLERRWKVKIECQQNHRPVITYFVRHDKQRRKKSMHIKVIFTMRFDNVLTRQMAGIQVHINIVDKNKSKALHRTHTHTRIDWNASESYHSHCYPKSICPSCTYVCTFIAHNFQVQCQNRHGQLWSRWIIERKWYVSRAIKCQRVHTFNDSMYTLNSPIVCLYWDTHCHSTSPPAQTYSVSNSNPCKI